MCYNVLTKDRLHKWGEELGAAGKSNSKQALIDMQISLYAYCKVVRKAFTDEAYKVARLVLVKHFQEGIGDAIRKRMIDGGVGRLVGLMQEDPAVAEERARVQLRLERCKKHLPKLEGKPSSGYGSAQ